MSVGFGHVIALTVRLLVGFRTRRRIGLPEIPEPETYPQVFAPLSCRLERSSSSCGAAVGAGLHPSIVGVYCVASGNENAAAYTIVGPNKAARRSVTAISFPCAQLFNYVNRSPSNQVIKYDDRQTPENVVHVE